MTNIEHLVENGLNHIKTKHYDEWIDVMKQDSNWQSYIKMSIDELWEVCQYIYCSGNWYGGPYFDEPGF